MAGAGRPPRKKQHIVDELRGRIIAGEFAPGARLPTRRQCAEEFGATLTTVQQALSNLEDDGVIVSHQGRGTFVADKPPHLTRFALVFPTERESGRWGLFWGHLAEVGQRVVKEEGVKLSIYTGIDKHRPGEDFERLLDDVCNDRVAGIIFATNPFLVEGTPIVDRPGVPRVMIASATGEVTPIARLSFDHASFVRKVAGILQDKGVVSTAVLGQPANRSELLLQELDRANIACPYQYQQAVTLDDVSWAKHITRLMFDADNPTRPEALIILDDNLFDPAVAGILGAGLRIPQDVELVTHCNFPWQLSSPFAVSRIGYDMHELLQLALAELAAQREGAAPQDRLLRVVTEDDLPADYTTVRRGTVTQLFP